MRNTMIRFFDNQYQFYTPKQINMLEWCLTDRFKLQVEAVRACTDDNEKAVLKDKLPCAMPSLQMDGTHSGFIAIDVDGKDNPGLTAVEMKEFISSVSTVLYCGYSCSGKGVWALIRILHTHKHAAHWQALRLFFLNNGIKIDIKCKNINRYRYASYDPEPYINENAETFRMYIDEVPEPKVKLKLPDFVEAENIFKKFNQYADLVTILKNNGWKVLKIVGSKTYLTRPGKDGGVSGIVYGDEKRFYPYSSNAPSLVGGENGGKQYNACSLMLALECNNDNKILAEKIKEILNIK